MPTLDHAFARIRFALVFLLFVFMSLLGAARALAQFDMAAVVGTVRDSSGGLVPGAKVTLTSSETGISASKTTGDDGNYEFPAVRPGVYVVTAEKTGFALALVDNLRAQVGARLRVDLQMPVGQMTERVDVTAAQPLLETDSSQRGQVITGDQTRALPLLSREYSALALLTTSLVIPVDPRIAIDVDGNPAGVASIDIVAGLAFWIVVTLLASALPVRISDGVQVAAGYLRRAVDDRAVGSLRDSL